MSLYPNPYGYAPYYGGEKAYRNNSHKARSKSQNDASSQYHNDLDRSARYGTRKGAGYQSTRAPEAGGRTGPESLSDRYRPIKIYVFKNGDRLFPGVDIPVTRQRFQHWVTFLDYLTDATKSIHPIHYLFDTNGTEILDFTELQDHQDYVAASTQPLVKIKYGRGKSKKAWNKDTIIGREDPSDLNSTESIELYLKSRKATEEAQQRHGEQRPPQRNKNNNKRRNNYNYSKPNSPPKRRNSHKYYPDKGRARSRTNSAPNTRRARDRSRSRSRSKSRTPPRSKRESKRRRSNSNESRERSLDSLFRELSTYDKENAKRKSRSRSRSRSRSPKKSKSRSRSRSPKKSRSRSRSPKRSRSRSRSKSRSRSNSPTGRNWQTAKFDNESRRSSRGRTRSRDRSARRNSKYSLVSRNKNSRDSSGSRKHRGSTGSSSGKRQSRRRDSYKTDYNIETIRPDTHEHYRR